MAAKLKIKAKSIDEYLAAVTVDQRAALAKVRRAIKAAAPQAEEGISYGLAAFRLGGKPLVAFGASTNHCAFYPMSGNTVASLRDELKDYETSKGTIRFAADKPLPAALVRKLVKARIAENEAQREVSDEGKKRGAKAKSAQSQTDPAVAAFLRELDHPLKKEIDAVRLIILGVSSEIREGIKWNGPSFRTTEWFATVFLRARDKVQLIFHKGAKVKDNSTKTPIADPSGLIEWLAADRCRVTLGAGTEIHAKRAAFEAIVRRWIAQM